VKCPGNLWVQDTLCAWSEVAADLQVAIEQSAVFLDPCRFCIPQICYLGQQVACPTLGSQVEVRWRPGEGKPGRKSEAEWGRGQEKQRCGLGMYAIAE
jgi:hypothetical protein